MVRWRGKAVGTFFERGHAQTADARVQQRWQVPSSEVYTKPIASLPLEHRVTIRNRHSDPS